MRALVYFDIVRKWGDAPLVTSYLATPAEIEAHTFREDKKKIYEQIVEDLELELRKVPCQIISLKVIKGEQIKQLWQDYLEKYI